MARILVVDDEDLVRTMVARVIERDGHQVHTADDGAMALDLLSVAPPFDLMVSDIRMPMMDGIALALNAARDFPDMSILLMTGYAEQRERAGNLAEIVEDVLSKPFTLTDLSGAVARILNKRLAGAPSEQAA